jgi:FolB domain-containing protein
MNDEIRIKDLLLRAIVGINDDERVKKQDVLINIWMYCDVSAAAADDDIHQAVNYRTVAKQVIELVENSSFMLVERLAEEIAGICLAAGVPRTRVRVEKPGALRFAASVGVTIERTSTGSA